MVFNPTDDDFDSEKVELPLYYSGLTDEVEVEITVTDPAAPEWDPERIVKFADRLNRGYNLEVEIKGTLNVNNCTLQPVTL